MSEPETASAVKPPNVPTLHDVTLFGRWPIRVYAHEVKPLWLWDTWERGRFESMARYLTPGTVLFDIGTEQGDVSIVYAQFVGGENMVLFEPHPDLWPNVRAHWTANNLPDPRACAVLFLGAVAKDATNRDFVDEFDGVWPRCATGPFHLCCSFRHMTEHGHATPTTTLDQWVTASGIVPGAITIDVEGAELEVLTGAWHTLETVGPPVWVSIHPEMMRDRYNRRPQELQDLMWAHGYVSEFLQADHEEHWRFWRPAAWEAAT